MTAAISHMESQQVTPTHNRRSGRVRTFSVDHRSAGRYTRGVAGPLRVAGSARGNGGNAVLPRRCRRLPRKFPDRPVPRLAAFTAVPATGVRGDGDGLSVSGTGCIGIGERMPVENRTGLAPLDAVRAPLAVGCAVALIIMARTRC